MRGFELRAKFYPLVPTLAQLAEEAKEGVDYPFEVRQVLQLQNKEYQQLCKALDKGYGFERMLPEEGLTRCTALLSACWSQRQPESKAS